MSVDAHETRQFTLTAEFWVNVVVGGIVAGLLMGVVMYQVLGIMETVGGLYGFESTVFGWLAHLWHSVVFALMFGAFFAWPSVERFRTQVLASMSIGIIWGVVLWGIAAGFVMPLWIGQIAPTQPPVPSLDPISGLGHVLYGAVLGSVSAAIHKRT